MSERDAPAGDERFDEQLTFRISSAMRDRIARLARRDDRSVAYIARIAIEKGLEQLERER